MVSSNPPLLNLSWQVGQTRLTPPIPPTESFRNLRAFGLRLTDISGAYDRTETHYQSDWQEDSLMSMSEDALSESSVANTARSVPSSEGESRVATSSGISSVPEELLSVIAQDLPDFRSLHSFASTCRRFKNTFHSISRDSQAPYMPSTITEHQFRQIMGYSNYISSASTPLDLGLGAKYRNRLDSVVTVNENSELASYSKRYADLDSPSFPVDTLTADRKEQFSYLKRELPSLQYYALATEYQDTREDGPPLKYLYFDSGHIHSVALSSEG